jgi:hypothetical protein
MPQTPLFMCGMSATHVAFSRSYPPLRYYLTERSLFKKCPPPHGKIRKKGPAVVSEVNTEEKTGPAISEKIAKALDTVYFQNPPYLFTLEPKLSRFTRNIISENHRRNISCEPRKLGF